MKLFPRSPQTSASTASDLQKANEWTEYCDSELIPTELIPTEQSDCSGSQDHTILTLIKNLWQNAIAAITKEPELKVWQTQDRHGHIHWHVYDPWTGESISFFSETAMLCWIENRYCR